MLTVTHAATERNFVLMTHSIHMYGLYVVEIINKNLLLNYINLIIHLRVRNSC